VQTAPGLPMSHLTHEISEPVLVGPGPLDIDTFINVAVHLLIAAQASELRGGLPGRPAMATAVDAIRELSPALAEDRPLDHDIEAVYQAVASGLLGQPLPGGA
jgi:hypothetical protein